MSNAQRRYRANFHSVKTLVAYTQITNRNVIRTGDPSVCLLGTMLAPEKVKVKSLGHVRLFATPWTVAHQDPPSMGFSRQEYWSGLPLPSPGDLPDPGIESGSPAL